MKSFRTASTLGILAVSAVAVASLAASPVSTASSSASPVPRPGGGPAPHTEPCPPRAVTLFCETFESHPVGGASSPAWDVNTRHGTLRVEPLRQGTKPGAHTQPGASAKPGTSAKPGASTKALHVHTEDNGLAFLTVNDFSAPGNHFFGRLRLKVDEFPTAPDWAHFTLVEATGAGSAEVVRPLGGQFAPTVGPDAVFWGVGADGGPTGDWTNWRESAPAVADTWQCVEFEWDGDEDRISVWFDGIEQPDLEVDRANHGGAATDFVLPEVNTIKLGWQLYQGGTTPDHFDLWLDDLAFASARIGC